MKNRIGMALFGFLFLGLVAPSLGMALPPGINKRNIDNGMPQTENEAHYLANMALKNDDHRKNHTVLIWKIPKNSQATSAIPAAKDSYYDIHIDWTFNGTFDWQRHVSYANPPRGAYRTIVPRSRFHGPSGYRVMIIKGRIDHFTLKDYAVEDNVRPNLYQVWNLADHQTTSYRHAFDGCENLKMLFIWNSQHIRNAMGRVRDISYMFANTPKLVFLDPFLRFPNATDASGMFKNAGGGGLTLRLGRLFPGGSRIQKVNDMFGGGFDRLDIKGMWNWDTSQVTHAEYLFQNLKDFSKLNNLTFPNAISVKGMFRNAGKDDDVLDVKKILTGHRLQNTSYLFDGMGKTQLTGMIGAHWNQVTDASFMFRGLKDFNPPWIKMSNVRNAQGMFANTSYNGKWRIWLGNLFQYATNLQNIGSIFRDSTFSQIDGLSKWKTGNVTQMFLAFHRSHVTNFEGIKDWNVSKVKDMSYAFSGLKKSNNLMESIKNWNTSNTRNMAGAFTGMVFDEDYATFPLDTSKVERMEYMFYNTVYPPLKGFRFDKAKNMHQMYYGAKLNENRIRDVALWSFQQDQMNLTDIFSHLKFGPGDFTFTSGWKNYNQLNTNLGKAFDSFFTVHKNLVATYRNVNSKLNVNAKGVGQCGYQNYPGEYNFFIERSEYDRLVNTCENVFDRLELTKIGVRVSSKNQVFPGLAKHFPRNDHAKCNRYLVGGVWEWPDSPYCIEAHSEYFHYYGTPVGDNEGPILQRARRWLARQFQCLTPSHERHNTYFCEEIRFAVRDICDANFGVLEPSTRMLQSPGCQAARKYFEDRE